ncbi:hypothetical protein CY35_05G119500 [Sphagnum magellanicum]|jgi:cytochrome b-561|nr:hypothetical protein CY35_05G119500 [Sphagnum magellanicum]
MHPRSSSHTRREQIGDDDSSSFNHRHRRTRSRTRGEQIDKERTDSSQGMAKYSGITSKQLLPIVHVLAILVLVILIVWNYYFRGGFGLSGNGVFNLHPVFQFAAFGYLTGQAILVFKTVDGDKTYQKAVHLTLNGVAVLVGLVGVAAAYKFHLDNKFDNFYSLHSWFGITTIIFYLVQWIVGFVSFWTQSIPSAQRAEVLPWHVFFGFTTFVLALVTIQLGLLEKLTFLQKGSPPLGLWSREALLVNSLGIIVFIYGAIVVLSALIPHPTAQEGYRSLE